MNPILKRTLTGLAVGAAVIAAVLVAPSAAIAPAVACLAVLAVVEYAILLGLRLRRWSMAWCFALLAGAVVIVCGLGALPRIAALYAGRTCGGVALGNLMVLYAVATIKFSDVGGFAFGVTSQKLMKGGNHKLCPTISPNKSWEGLAGSVFASCLVSCCFAGVTGFGLAKSLALGAMAALVGTFGDLVESRFKRWVGVKDSSAMKFTNGLGGFLDMFDSLLFALPAFLAFLP